MTVDEIQKLMVDVRTSELPCPWIPTSTQLELRKKPTQLTPPTVAMYCESVDLVDWIYTLIGTAHRRAQSLAVRWPDIDLDTGILRPAKKLIRVRGEGLRLANIDESDPKGSNNEIALPEFVVEALKIRRKRLAQRQLLHPDPIGPEFADLIFPSECWTPRDPNNVGKQWRVCPYRIEFAPQNHPS